MKQPARRWPISIVHSTRNSPATSRRTRRGWPLGFERILPHLRSAANVLDVGCGNGRLLSFLTEHGWHGRYLGVDSSAGLIAAAEQNRELRPAEASFRLVDLLSPHWAVTPAGFAPDAIACLAVLHHIPGAAHRARLVAECADLLEPGGILIISVWQFLEHAALAGARVALVESRAER